MRTRTTGLAIGFLLLVLQTGSLFATEAPSSLYYVRSTDQRLRAPEQYFAHEYVYINKRRGKVDDASKRPERLAGLAMSGGGIRSTAFQLGVLSGLRSVSVQGKSLLDAIDYTSSVSGGSWANGAYWAAKMPDDVLFGCLDAYAHSGENTDGCADANKLLRSWQSVLRIPYDDGKLKKRKEKWEEDIRNVYLPYCNVDFANTGEFAECLAVSETRPYPIINSTHSAVRERGDPRNSPFEFTPHYLGTVIDETQGKGFFMPLRTSEFTWEWRRWQRYIALSQGNRADTPAATLSMAMAHSSGVVGKNKPILLEYNFHVRQQGKPVPHLRDKYKLVDGGKSENIGVLPLLERGVDVILASRMGKENYTFGDVSLAAAQAKRLFGCWFRSSYPRDVAPVVIDNYRCDATAKAGTLVQIRPTTNNVGGFMSFLAQSNPVLHEALIEVCINT